jgi:nitroreductase
MFLSPLVTPGSSAEPSAHAGEPRRARSGARGGDFWRGLASALSLLGAACGGHGSDLPETPARPLPPPAVEGSHLLQALRQRQTSREFSPAPLAPQLVADILWAAGGVNRPATGQRTAPTAHDWRYVDIYVFDAAGVSIYDPEHHALRPLLPKDLRALTGLQDFAATAPLSLLYVADEHRMGKGVDGETRALFEAASVGAMFQDVYLLGAERGVAVGVRADIDRKALAKALGLAPQQRIVMAQSVGQHPSATESVGGDAGPRPTH